MFRIVINDERLLGMVIEKGHKCLCTVEETDCMCTEFLTDDVAGECHCGVYKKILVEDR